ncbi:hypothetical protein AVS7_04388 [Acidovorax sp. MR-S7]|nr:hypothetical protein AVS7_04388 [Acidovorax sp. MR-S7]
MRLARYGLMAPEAFADEMRERMGMDDDAPMGQAVIPSTEPADGSEIEIQVAVACIGASGSWRPTRARSMTVAHYTSASPVKAWGSAWPRSPRHSAVQWRWPACVRARVLNCVRWPLTEVLDILPMGTLLAEHRYSWRLRCVGLGRR